MFEKKLKGVYAQDQTEKAKSVKISISSISKARKFKDPTDIKLYRGIQ